MEAGEPLYASRRTWLSLGQQYRVYPDRIEMRMLTGRRIIRSEAILSMEVRPPVAAADLFRGKGFAGAMALKLDLCDLCRHVLIHRRCGLFRWLRIAPDDPDRFVESWRAACAGDTADV